MSSARATLTIEDLIELTGLSKSTIYELVNRKELPRPFAMGRRSVWLKAAVMRKLERKHERAQR